MSGESLDLPDGWPSRASSTPDSPSSGVFDIVAIASEHDMLAERRRCRTVFRVIDDNRTKVDNKATYVDEKCDKIKLTTEP